MPENIPQKILAELISAHTGCSANDLSFLQVPTGKFNTTYFVEGAGRPLVLRIAPPDDAGFIFYERKMMAQEPGIHKIIRERTNVPVAEILAYDNTRKLINRDYIIMEKLPGIPLTQFPCNHFQYDKILEQTGRYLRQIHSITSAKYGYLGEHNCMDPQDTWLDAFTVMWNKLVDDIAMAGYYDSQEENYVRSLLNKHIKCFDRPVTSRLLHMDVWSQNILVDNDANVTGLIDFDRALWGDKEIEFAVLDYCGISEPAFWKGYGVERDTSEQARIRRIFYLLYEIQKYIIIRHYRSKDPSSALRYKTESFNIMKML